MPRAHPAPSVTPPWSYAHSQRTTHTHGQRTGSLAKGAEVAVGDGVAGDERGVVAREDMDALLVDAQPRAVAVAQLLHRIQRRPVEFPHACHVVEANTQVLGAPSCKLSPRIVELGEKGILLRGAFKQLFGRGPTRGRASHNVAHGRREELCNGDIRVSVGGGEGVVPPLHLRHARHHLRQQCWLNEELARRNRTAYLIRQQNRFNLVRTCVTAEVQAPLEEEQRKGDCLDQTDANLAHLLLPHEEHVTHLCPALNSMAGVVVVMVGRVQRESRVANVTHCQTCADLAAHLCARGRSVDRAQVVAAGGQFDADAHGMGGLCRGFVLGSVHVENGDDLRDRRRMRPGALVEAPAERIQAVHREVLAG
eukprot:m.1299541 g.1299541  ORF g.1299541 m.1299541 type:complete len:366 (+) comp24800_c0_seq42:2562-3659(+)